MVVTEVLKTQLAVHSGLVHFICIHVYMLYLNKVKEKLPPILVGLATVPHLPY